MNTARNANEWQDVYGGGFAAEAQLRQVPVELLDPWTDANGEGQPFHVYTKEKFDEMVESVRQRGIITPLNIRPIGRRFQILAGHNRCAAAKVLGLRTVPALVADVDDAEATLIMIDSNLKQRQKLTPSEKAKAYKMMLEAMKRQGQRSDRTSPTSTQVVSKSRTDEEIGQQNGDSREQVRRYIRLNSLIPELLEMVDNNQLKFVSAVELSYLPAATQQMVLDELRDGKKNLTTAKAKNLHSAMPTAKAAVRALMGDTPKAPMLTIRLKCSSQAEVAALARNTDFQAAAEAALRKLMKKHL